jgi:hypothetical protein
VYNIKKTVIIFILSLSCAAVCSAGETSLPVIISKPRSESVEMLTGKVISVSVADSTKGMRSEIIIAGEGGRQRVLVVKATTTIYDAAWKAIDLDTLQKNDRVKVKYITTGEGLSEALSIKQLP